MSSSNFVDHIRVYCKSGNGGAGSVHFIRTRLTPMGGPDGGNGGRGGHVILVGNSQLWTLLHLRYTKHLLARDGENGRGALRTGADAADIIVEVPLGTIIKDAETGEVEAEITEHGQRLIIAKGGRGGMGNDYFKTATHRAPRFAQPGEEGTEGWKIFELKLLADVGLVGFPNAGKSTLLSAISAARPEIADYPFTTLRPNLGIVNYRDGRSFVMADIPGIIEGAHEGKGLGLRFLRHIERNSALLFMVPADADSIRAQYEILLNELKQYNPELLDKQRVLAVTKSDLLDEIMQEQMEADLPGDLPVVFISSHTTQGLQKLKDLLWTELNKPFGG